MRRSRGLVRGNTYPEIWPGTRECSPTGHKTGNNRQCRRCRKYKEVNIPPSLMTACKASLFISALVAILAHGAECNEFGDRWTNPSARPSRLLAYSGPSGLAPDAYAGVDNGPDPFFRDLEVNVAAQKDGSEFCDKPSKFRTFSVDVYELQSGGIGRRWRRIGWTYKVGVLRSSFANYLFSRSLCLFWSLGIRAYVHTMHVLVQVPLACSVVDDEVEECSMTWKQTRVPHALHSTKDTAFPGSRSSFLVRERQWFASSPWQQILHTTASGKNSESAVFVYLHHPTHLLFLSLVQSPFDEISVRKCVAKARAAVCKLKLLGVHVCTCARFIQETTPLTSIAGRLGSPGSRCHQVTR